MHIKMLGDSKERFVVNKTLYFGEFRSEVYIRVRIILINKFSRVHELEHLALEGLKYKPSN